MYGKLLNNEYLIINMIGRGVYSKVWLTYKISTEEFVALKMIDDEDDEVALRETELNKELSSSSKLKMLIDDFTFQDDSVDYWCLVFPLLGGTLYNLRKSNNFSEDFLNRIYKEAVEMLKELHEKFEFIHGDIKPENFAFKGINPISKSIIERFNNLGGLKAYLEKYTSLELSCSKLIDDLLTDDDMNSELFDVYNSSNDSDDEDNEDDFEDEEDDDDDDEDEDDDDEDDEDNDDDDDEDNDDNNDDNNTNNVGSDDDTKSMTDLSEITIEDLGLYKVSEDVLNNTQLYLIDYSHAHKTDEDLYFEPTRYYRCIQTLKKQSAGYYKDWFALACTMYELETGELFVDPQSDNKDEEQIQFIEENIHKLDKWLKDKN